MSRLYRDLDINSLEALDEHAATVLTVKEAKIAAGDRNRQRPSVTELVRFAMSAQADQSGVIRRSIGADLATAETWLTILEARGASDFQMAAAAASDTVIELSGNAYEERIELRQSAADPKIAVLIIYLSSQRPSVPTRLGVRVGSDYEDVQLPEPYDSVCQVEFEASSSIVEFLRSPDVRVFLW